MPLPTLAATITSAGISAPTYDAILQSLQESFQAIYGADAYIAADSQDGQMLAVFAKAFDDANQMAIAVYQSFSPTYAQGAGLSSNVKINGISRKVPTNSTAPGDVVGVAGTVITGGVVADTNGNLWDLPATVTIPGGGSISVTVTAQEAGAISALASTINKINNPSLGWQSFTSTSDATVGDPVESDSELRARQRGAASLPSVTPGAGVLAALQALVGVTDARVYENATGAPDTNGIPARSISAVVEGGTLSEIAEAIGQKKTPGANTYGTTLQTYVDPITGIPYTISFFILDYEDVTVELDVEIGDGWGTSIEAEIQQAVADYVNGLQLGSNVLLRRLWAPAFLNGAADGSTYQITDLTLNGGTADVTVAFNKAARLDPADVVITIVP